jgi:rubredoxin
MAEAAYKSAVLKAGKTQTSLTPGWEVLGLEKDVAQRIWDETAKDGFLTDREVMYGGQTTRYDKKGNKLTKDGKLQNPDDAVADDTKEPVSGVFECGDCGFTLFVAAGRETKFYGSGFKCPKCGAGKSKFTQRDDFDEDE